MVTVTWARLTAAARRSAADLWSPLPPGDGCCPVCRGPTRPGYPRCYQCAMHRAAAPGWLADLVVPISYAPKDGEHYARLCRYKTDAPGATAARAVLRALLLTFLREHGPCLWPGAALPPPARLAVPARLTVPGQLAVVPSGQGRPGPHPLARLLAPLLVLAPAPLAIDPDEPLGRSLNPDRFRASPSVAGQTVLLVDDTWVSGASAQSAAVALHRAGARRVIVVVLGRVVDPADPGSAGLLARMGDRGYDRSACAVPTPAAGAVPTPAATHLVTLGDSKYGQVPPSPKLGSNRLTCDQLQK
jgi:hypothetical protein